MPCIDTELKSSTEKDCVKVENFLNSMMLHVKVPVLSEKIYSIWPSSSLMFVVYALAAKSWSVSYMPMSQLMNVPCQNLTISSVTMSEIGTKLLSKKEHQLVKGS